MDLTSIFTKVLDGDTQSIFLLVSAYAFAVCLYSFVYQRRVSSWPSVRGRLLRSEVAKSGGTEWARSDQEYVADALYEYEVDGEAHRGRRISAWVVVASHNLRSVLEAQLKEITQYDDGSVAVFYNPKKPAKSLLVKPGWVGQLVTLALGLAPAILYWLRYH